MNICNGSLHLFTLSPVRSMRSAVCFVTCEIIKLHRVKLSRSLLSKHSSTIHKVNKLSPHDSVRILNSASVSSLETNLTKRKEKDCRFDRISICCGATCQGHPIGYSKRCHAALF